VKERAEKVYLLAFKAYAETLFIDTAQAAVFVKKFTGRGKVHSHFARAGKGALIAAQPAAVTEEVPVFPPFPVLRENTQRGPQHGYA
jgi:hypothetical protein